VQRECFLLKEEAGLSLDAIAQIVDANYEACKSRLRYAYESLRQCIERKIGGKLND
jgi:RNA polymerase sigma-70 factor (ECF subfamily)